MYKFRKDGNRVRKVVEPPSPVAIAAVRLERVERRRVFAERARVMKEIRRRPDKPPKPDKPEKDR